MKDETETAIQKFCEHYTGGNTIIKQIRENLAMSSRSIDKASVQATENSKSSDHLAEGLNTFTKWLMIVGAANFLALVVQIVVAVIHY